MKVVFAVTEEQKKTINELTQYLYSSVFPCYLNDGKIDEFIEVNKLQSVPTWYQSVETSGEALKLIASLQVIISILEMPAMLDNDYYVELFSKNERYLNERGLTFPFTVNEIVDNDHVNITFSLYTTPSNEYLI